MLFSPTRKGEEPLFYILFTRAAEAEAREVQVAVVEPVWLPLVVTQQRPAYFCFPLAFP